MKIAILGFTKIKYMPYMHFYLDQIDAEKNDVHLIYWKRDSLPDAAPPTGVTLHAFDCVMSDAIPLRKKLPCILKYGRFAKKAVKKLSPDLLIVLHSTTAVSVYGLLKGKYKNRYIFDYRDVTYENISAYKRLVGRIVEGSRLSFTSSDGFRKYLPDTPKLLTSHNINNVHFKDDIKAFLPRGKHEPVRVAYWGMLRNRRVNEEIIKKLGGDRRFELHYYGRAQGGMLDLMTESTKRYENVFFHGEYSPTDRFEMAKNTDIIHNLYSVDDKTAHIAMGNKYYDGLVFALPQICTKGSLMGELCTEHKIGFECDPFDDDFADNIYNYYMSLSEDELLTGIENELSRVLSELDKGSQKIKEVLQNV